MPRSILLCAAFVLASVSACSQAVLADQPFYIGTYTRGESRGIYVSSLKEDGSLTPPKLAAEVENPSFLTSTADGLLVFAVGEMASFQGERSGVVSSFNIQDDGSLKLINQVSSGGRGPCHVEIVGNYLVISNYSGGSFASVPFDAQGQLKPVVTHLENAPVDRDGKEAKSLGHGAYAVPGTNLVLGADKGLDCTHILRLDGATGTLTRHDPAKIETDLGSGPRHLDINAAGDRVYVLNELASTIDVYQFDSAAGTARHLAKHNTLPEGFDGKNTTAEIFLHPSGRFLYASNRGHDSIAMFRVGDEGDLTALGHVSTEGNTPRNFNIDPSGKFLLAANQNSHNIVVFKIDPREGTLQPLAGQIEVPNPVCIEFISAN